MVSQESSFRMPNHTQIQTLLALFVACFTFMMTILFTSGAFGHELGKCKVVLMGKYPS